MNKPWVANSRSEAQVLTSALEKCYRSGPERCACAHLRRRIHAPGQRAQPLATRTSSHVKVEVMREPDINASGCVLKSRVKEDTHISSLHCS